MSARLTIGSTWGRWEVIKRATPAQRYGEAGTRARVIVRCVCQRAVQTMFESDLRSRKSGGCRSAKCAARWEAACALREHLRASQDAAMRALEGEIASFLARAG